MLKKLVFLVVVAAAPLTFLMACASLKSGFEVPTKHPYEFAKGQRPTCTECHEARDKNLDYQLFNHNPSFVANHRMVAYSQQRVCAMCHATSFCNDCHAGRVELKPSIKDQTENYRWMPHRGDYLSRHRIDGRLDPTSCFRCHGNPKSAETCAPCHGEYLMDIRRIDMHKLAAIFFLFFLVSLTGGCANDNSSAPNDNQPHLMGAQWLLPSEHAAAAIDDSPPCFSCHQEGGGTISPDCRQCHTAGPPKFVLGTCDSSHGAPPDGQTRPTRPGPHPPPTAPPPAPDAGPTSPHAPGTGTLNHYDTSAPADVAFLSAYNAKSGPANFPPDAANPGTGTCSNVSCHGGQQTPDWLTGQIDVDRDCTKCHQLGTAPQTPQYNSPYSGQHQFHAGTLGFACFICHDFVKLQSGHFIGLDTPQFEGDPGATIQDFIGYDPQAMTCTTNNAACHAGETRSW